MGIFDLFEALIKLGIPMIALSWFIFSWLYNSEKIDREAGRKAISSHVKTMRKSFASKEKDEKERDGTKEANYIYDKWMWFGGGFYGLAGLWTFAVIETTQLFSFVFNFPGISILLQDGVVSFVVTLLLNQLGNVISAFVWFAYWDIDSVFVSLLVAYFGYWAGVELARRDTEFSISALLEKFSDDKPQD